VVISFLSNKKIMKMKTYIYIIVVVLTACKMNVYAQMSDIDFQVKGSYSTYYVKNINSSSGERLQYWNILYNYNEYRKQYPPINPINEVMLILVKDHDKVLQAVTSSFGIDRIKELAEDNCSFRVVMDISNIISVALFFKKLV
jgi:hypothetical protein